MTPPALHRRWFNRARISSGAGGIVGPTAGAVLAASGLGVVFVCAGLSRRPGFTAYQPTDDAFFALFAQLRMGRLIP